MNRRAIVESIVFVALVVGGAAVRLALQDLPNFAPVAALALFAGYYFRRQSVAAGVPLLVMGLSDLWIGGYDLRLMATVYGMLAAPVLVRGIVRRSFELAPGRWGRAATSAAGLVGCSLLSSVLFFLVTNFAVWALATESYSKDFAGLSSCYAAAVPFFRYTLAGDLCFSCLLFGGYAVAVTASRAPAPSAVPA